MKKRVLSMLLATLIFGTLLGGCGSNQETSASDADNIEDSFVAAEGRELRLSLPVPEGTDTYNQAVEAKTYIEEKTNGELTVTLFPANTLGDWTQVFDELMMGSIDMAISNSPDTYNPILGVVSRG